MSEQTGAPAEGAENPEVTQGDPADKPLGPNGEKALKAEREARAAAEKAATELQAKLDEIAKANLSDLERAQREAQEARDAAATAAAEALRYRLAAKHGLNDEDAKFLVGDEANMEALAARLAAVNAAPRTPVPDPTQGGRGTPPALNSDGLEQALREKLGIA